jgi:hypothetical protein
LRHLYSNLIKGKEDSFHEQQKWDDVLIAQRNFPTVPANFDELHKWTGISNSTTGTADVGK